MMCLLHQKKLVLCFLFLFILLGSYMMRSNMKNTLWPKDPVILSPPRYGSASLHCVLKPVYMTNKDKLRTFVNFVVHYALYCIYYLNMSWFLSRFIAQIASGSFFLTTIISSLLIR